jgi:hypothetical protein
MTPCLLTKDGVQFGRIKPAGFKILAVLQAATFIFDRDLTITCGTEAHPPSDPHSTGEAYDVRALNMADATILALHNYLRQHLGDPFTVLYETPQKPAGVLASIAVVNPKASAPHFHIQRKAGTVYPPTGGTT